MACFVALSWIICFILFLRFNLICLESLLFNRPLNHPVEALGRLIGGT